MNAGPNDAPFKKMLAGLPLVKYRADEYVLHAESKTGRFLILQSGAVAIIKNGIQIARVDEPGAFLGELSALLDQPHNADVVTLEESQFYIADAKLFEKNPISVFFVAKVLARRLDGVTKGLVELRKQMQAGHPPRALSKTLNTIEAALRVGASFEPIKTIQKDLQNVERSVSTSLHEHSRLYLLQGVALVMLGFVVVFFPPLAMLGLSFLLGSVLILNGVMGLFSTLLAQNASGFWSSLLMAALGVAVGIILCAMPVEGGFFLTVVLLIVFFFIEGTASIMLALEHRREMSGKWGWILASGVIDVVAVVLIFTYLRGDTAWKFGGLLVGINMMVGGAALIFMAQHARKTVV